jgi:hypothetical protein
MSPIRRALGQMQAPFPPLLTAPNQTARFTTRSGELFESPRAWLHGGRNEKVQARNDRYEKCQQNLGHLKSYRPWIKFRVALRPLLNYINSPVPVSDQFSRPTGASIAERPRASARSRPSRSIFPNHQHRVPGNSWSTARAAPSPVHRDHTTLSLIWRLLELSNPAISKARRVSRPLCGRSSKDAC